MPFCSPGTPDAAYFLYKHKLQQHMDDILSIDDIIESISSEKLLGGDPRPLYAYNGPVHQHNMEYIGDQIVRQAELSGHDNLYDMRCAVHEALRNLYQHHKDKVSYVALYVDHESIIVVCSSNGKNYFDELIKATEFTVFDLEDEQQIDHEKFNLRIGTKTMLGYSDQIGFTEYNGSYLPNQTAFFIQFNKASQPSTSKKNS